MNLQGCPMFSITASKIASVSRSNSQFLIYNVICGKFSLGNTQHSKNMNVVETEKKMTEITGLLMQSQTL